MTQLPQYQNPLAIAMPPGFECARVSVKVTSENYRDVIAFVAKAVRNGVPLFAPDEIPPGAENSAQPYRVCPPGEAEAAPKRRKPSIATLVKRAEKTGKAVTSITTRDGTTINFGDPKPSEANNPWLADIAKATKQ
jgi:hypothetical protein